MGRPRQSLLQAVRRAKREHRLTDFLILVLEAHQGFANRLLREAGLPEAVEVEATAEVYTRRGRPVDMEMLGFDASGGRLARLWSENKVGADYQPDQLPDYATDLPGLPAARQLITIVDHLSEVPADPLHPEQPRWRPFTWRDIARMAWEAGREAASPADVATWQEAALRPDVPASQRILFELLNYLEEEHGVVLEPFGYEHVAAFALMADTGEMLDELVRRAAEFAHLDTEGDVKWSNESDRLWQSFDATGTWAEPLGGAPKLQAANSDDWGQNRVGEPALGAGYSVPKSYADTLLSEGLRAWRDALGSEGFAVSVEDSVVRVWRTKYIAELIPLGITLDSQVREVARWLDETLAILAQHDPGMTT